MPNLHYNSQGRVVPTSGKGQHGGRALQGGLPVIPPVAGGDTGNNYSGLVSAMYDTGRSFTATPAVVGGYGHTQKTTRVVGRGIPVLLTTPNKPTAKSNVRGSPEQALIWTLENDFGISYKDASKYNSTHTLKQGKNSYDKVINTMNVGKTDYYTGFTIAKDMATFFTQLNGDYPAGFKPDFERTGHYNPSRLEDNTMRIATLRAFLGNKKLMTMLESDGYKSAYPKGFMGLAENRDGMIQILNRMDQQHKLVLQFKDEGEKLSEMTPTSKTKEIIEMEHLLHSDTSQMTDAQALTAKRRIQDILMTQKRTRYGDVRYSTATKLVPPAFLTNPPLPPKYETTTQGDTSETWNYAFVDLHSTELFAKINEINAKLENTNIHARFDPLYKNFKEVLAKFQLVKNLADPTYAKSYPNINTIDDAYLKETGDLLNNPVYTDPVFMSYVKSVEGKDYDIPLMRTQLQGNINKASANVGTIKQGWTKAGHDAELVKHHQETLTKWGTEIEAIIATESDVVDKNDTYPNQAKGWQKLADSYASYNTKLASIHTTDRATLLKISMLKYKISKQMTTAKHQVEIMNGKATDGKDPRNGDLVRLVDESKAIDDLRHKTIGWTIQSYEDFIARINKFVADKAIVDEKQSRGVVEQSQRIWLIRNNSALVSLQSLTKKMPAYKRWAEAKKTALISTQMDAQMTDYGTPAEPEPAKPKTPGDTTESGKLLKTYQAEFKSKYKGSWSNVRFGDKGQSAQVKSASNNIMFLSTIGMDRETLMVNAGRAKTKADQAKVLKDAYDLIGRMNMIDTDNYAEQGNKQYTRKVDVQYQSVLKIVSDTRRKYDDFDEKGATPPKRKHIGGFIINPTLTSDPTKFKKNTKPPKQKTPVGDYASDAQADSKTDVKDDPDKFIVDDPYRIIDGITGVSFGYLADRFSIGDNIVGAFRGGLDKLREVKELKIAELSAVDERISHREGLSKTLQRTINDLTNKILKIGGKRKQSEIRREQEIIQNKITLMRQGSLASDPASSVSAPVGGVSEVDYGVSDIDGAGDTEFDRLTGRSRELQQPHLRIKNLMKQRMLTKQAQEKHAEATKLLSKRNMVLQSEFDAMKDKSSLTRELALKKREFQDLTGTNYDALYGREKQRGRTRPITADPNNPAITDKETRTKLKTQIGQIEASIDNKEQHERIAKGLGQIDRTVKVAGAFQVGVEVANYVKPFAQSVYDIINPKFATQTELETNEREHLHRNRKEKAGHANKEAMLGELGITKGKHSSMGGLVNDRTFRYGDLAQKQPRQNVLSRRYDTKTQGDEIKRMKVGNRNKQPINDFVFREDTKNNLKSSGYSMAENDCFLYHNKKTGETRKICSGVVNMNSYTRIA